MAPTIFKERARVVVVGAGVAGLAAALRLSHAGYAVTVLDRLAAPGGKMRAVPSSAGPIDAGPTVLTLRSVFDALFEAVGARLEDHITLIRQNLLARHFWPDGSSLDLFDDPEASCSAIRTFSGARSEREFRAFSARARRLFDAFDDPVMRAPRPNFLAISRKMLRHPGLVGATAPGRSLAALLDNSFSDPRLAQLFGRYATYVGGAPDRSPALLALIWQAESEGVWAVKGGMHRLAAAMAELATSYGAEIRMGTHVDRLEAASAGVCGALLSDGSRIPCDRVLFNGDPRALAMGGLGPDVEHVAPQTRRIPRSLSAEVWTFAAHPQGPNLALHNVFFRDDPQTEFDALGQGRLAPSPTLYICALDRATAAPPPTERFEIIANAPPIDISARHESPQTCQTRTFDALARFGLTFNPMPGAQALTTPADFERMFPHSAGAIYGQSPHGMMAAFRRPTARTAIPGLYLAGGGTHPGAGVPMAALSGQHAAEAIMTDHGSTSVSRRTATPGGTSTPSTQTKPARSAS
ncbi:1-hydroxycarotenoid 3,4-desaturase CrtD [Maritimibacter sp. UBA3975]|uniref:1-hydroxycarotenoid 3,4-desaturase CrtD n=1 Tax=Maritimibacter sp. UBA3975 TaxID=1946833 RepID=UPI000C0AFA02|nr:1-hydroxycarotenoid 3,4-desaturase CrtD [Maritimibacter sp. UBA3975]MAM62932.1 methoxyneurosporene dehydrogenase [Maritimibacter sp.]|tara:strand:- start:49612 stop:51183 length:1572 start_codon:yes stop_codon:yes gene_type:complete